LYDPEISMGSTEHPQALNDQPLVDASHRHDDREEKSQPQAREDEAALVIPDIAKSQVHGVPSATVTRAFSLSPLRISGDATATLSVFSTPLTTSIQPDGSEIPICTSRQ